MSMSMGAVERWETFKVLIGPYTDSIERSQSKAEKKEKYLRKTLRGVFNSSLKLLRRKTTWI